jgi:hypothetical protein
MAQQEQGLPRMTNKELFEQQKHMLLMFAGKGAISREYCGQEIRILSEKMHIDQSD